MDTPNSNSSLSEAKGLHATQLLRKDIAFGDQNARIEKQDKISIRLRDGFLKDCNEFFLKRNPMRVLAGYGFAKNCEIAILFKAFEITDKQDFNFKPGAEREARLVYFSHDVQPGQPFNLHNMPVYGPLDYKGHPIGIDIFIIETDAEDRQAFALLKSLASIGAMAYAPASPVLGVLDQLGTALLNSGTDDVELRYSMVLDPSGGYGGTTYATAEAGDYVFIRQEDRSQSTQWHMLWMDHNTGRVWKKKEIGCQEPANQADCLEPYTDNTYLTVQILRNAGSEDVQLAQNTYGEFRDALDRDATTKAQEIDKALVPQLKKLAIKRVQIKNFNRAQKLYESMVTHAQDASTKVLARQDAYDLYQILKDSTSALNRSKENEDKDAKKQEEIESDLSPDQVEALLQKLRTWSQRSKGSDLEKFTSKGFCTLTFDDFVKWVVEDRSGNS